MKPPDTTFGMNREPGKARRDAAAKKRALEAAERRYQERIDEAFVQRRRDFYAAHPELPLPADLRDAA